MNKTIRMTSIIPIPHDPTSWYRGIGPLSELQKQWPDLQLLFPPTIDWPSLKMCDVLFMQRPCDPNHLNTVMLAKELGIPVIIDFDDDNLAVPKDNPQYYQYNQMPIKEAIVKMARAADAIMVTNEQIKYKYSIYNKNIHIVPNALDDFLLKYRHSQPPKQKMILWRGTMTHNRNLKTVAPEIIKLAEENPDWKFGFFGYDPIDITENMKNVVLMGAPNAIETYKGLWHTHAHAGYYVLANNDHAQARSHISWLEYTFAGSASIVPNNKEFTRPGALNFSTPAEFYDLVTKVIKGEVDVQKQVEESWAHILENYLLSKVNLLRKEIIQKVVGLA